MYFKDVDVDGSCKRCPVNCRACKRDNNEIVCTECENNYSLNKQLFVLNKQK
jgi:hypothetical protein